MSELSDPTLAALIDGGRSLAITDLKTMLMRADLLKYADQKIDDPELLRATLLSAREASANGDTDERDQRYLHVSTPMAQEAMRRMGNALWTSGPGAEKPKTQTTNTHSTRNMRRRRIA